MSADSLNVSSPKNVQDNDIQSPIDDRTYTKHEDEKESNCERLSQVSPFLLSPTTDSSAPEPSDNVAGVSTVSKATVPTDAKSSKPSETQCLSKATSIDSWCSNDTLYNVEENFDDLAMDPDVPLDFEAEPVVDKSESEGTLTHNDDEKEASHCSTYIIHDSKSEACDTFSKDSIANDNHTYTKIKTEDTAATITKADINDCTKNTSIVDLVFGTPVCAMQSYANRTYELGSGLEYAWNLPQPEMVRRSPIDDTVNFTPPRDICEKGDITAEESPQMPQLTMKPCVKKMESVELSCLESPIQLNNSDSTVEKVHDVEVNSNQKTQVKDMLQSITSTPIVTVQDDENIDPISLLLPGENKDDTHFSGNAPNLQSFFASADNRTQDISSIVIVEPVSSILFEGESKTLSKDSNTERSSTERDVEISPINKEVPESNKHLVLEPPGYSDFENSANTKLQDNFSVRPNRNLESSDNSEDFRRFESSIQKCPQDLSSFIDASSCLIKNERKHSDLANKTISSSDLKNITQSFAEVESPVSISSNCTNLYESRELDNNSQPLNVFVTDLDIEEETEQPHSIIITQSPLLAPKVSPNVACDSNTRTNCTDVNYTYNSHTSANYPVKDVWQKDTSKSEQKDLNDITENLVDVNKTSKDYNLVNPISPLLAIEENSVGSHITCNKEIESNTQVKETETNTLVSDKKSPEASTSTQCNGSNEMYATVNFLNETFEELLESNVDDNEVISDLNKEDQTVSEKSLEIVTDSESTRSPATFDILEGPTLTMEQLYENRLDENGMVQEEKQFTSVTEDFLQNEKKYCQLDSFFPLLSDIRFTGPATEIMTTSFTQDSPTEPTSPECEQDSKPDATAEILKEWDSDSDSHSTNSSSGEFIWKDGDGRETAVVPSTRFDHQRDSNSQPSRTGSGDAPSSGGSASGDSASGSEGDEVAFVPSSWDCRAAPAKSSLRSLEHTPDSKKRVVFKRQKYHCVYEYPREVADVDADSPANYLPDFSTYSEWDPSSAEEAELGYGQLFGAPNPLDLFSLRAGIALGADYDEDFFISSSARPFESLGVMSSASQFFPGAHLKPRDLADELDDFPPPPSPLPTYAPPRTPSLDFTTPDSGVEDITPGSMTDDDYKNKKMPESETQPWRSIDSASSSESVSPSSPGSESLGGLRHTRDKLKLDLPPSPHVPSPKHNRVFNFVLDKPKREKPADIGTTPLVMTDETPVIAVPLPVPKDCDDVMPEPTFSTFGKSSAKPSQGTETEKNIILTDEENTETKEENNSKVEPVKGEGTVLDSGDEDSGIESSSKATLERNKTPNIS